MQVGYLQNLRKKESIFIILCMMLTLGVTLLSAHFKTGYWSAFALAIGMFSIISIFAFINKDGFLKRLLLLGIIAGLVELLADKYLVEDIASLVYPADEPKIWCSPNYMPFAWAVVLVEVGYLGWMISNKVKMVEAMLICMVIGFCFIPIFEQCAYYAGWWYYVPCKMLFNTPWYIIAAEGIICFFLPILFYFETKFKWSSALLFGIFEGLVIYAAYWFTFKIIE